jgi:hypothetical protein
VISSDNRGFSAGLRAGVLVWAADARSTVACGGASPSRKTRPHVVHWPFRPASSRRTSSRSPQPGHWTDIVGVGRAGDEAMAHKTGVERSVRFSPLL